MSSSAHSVVSKISRIRSLSILPRGLSGKQPRTFSAKTHACWALPGLPVQDNWSPASGVAPRWAKRPSSQAMNHGSRGAASCRWQAVTRAVRVIQVHSVHSANSSCSSGRVEIERRSNQGASALFTREPERSRSSLVPRRASIRFDPAHNTCGVAPCGP
jgi:hypothetical protein